MPIKLDGSVIIKVYLLGETDEFEYIGSFILDFQLEANSMYLGVV